MINYNELELEVLFKFYFGDKYKVINKYYDLFFENNKLILELKFKIKNFILNKTANLEFIHLYDNLYEIIYHLDDDRLKFLKLTDSERLFIECSQNGNELVSKNYPRNLKEKLKTII